MRIYLYYSFQFNYIWKYNDVIYQSKLIKSRDNQSIKKFDKYPAVYGGI